MAYWVHRQYRINHLEWFSDQYGRSVESLDDTIQYKEIFGYPSQNNRFIILNITTHEDEKIIIRTKAESMENDIFVLGLKALSMFVALSLAIWW